MENMRWIVLRTLNEEQRRAGDRLGARNRALGRRSRVFPKVGLVDPATQHRALEGSTDQSLSSATTGWTPAVEMIFLGKQWVMTRRFAFFFFQLPSFVISMTSNQQTSFHLLFHFELLKLTNKFYHVIVAVLRLQHAGRLVEGFSVGGRVHFGRETQSQNSFRNET